MKHIYSRISSTKVQQVYIDGKPNFTQTEFVGMMFPRQTRKVDVRLPGKGNSNSHGARPVHLMIRMIKWIRISRLSIKSSLSLRCKVGASSP